MHIFMIPQTGNTNCYQCTSIVTVTGVNSLQSVVMPGGSSSDLIYNYFFSGVAYLHLLHLILLSGDVERNPGPGLIAGNTPSTILRKNYAILIDAITDNLYRITNGLYAKGLISMETVSHIQTATGISDLIKSSQLVSVLQRRLEASVYPDQYLIDICHVLINQRHLTITDIATSILHHLGQSIPDNATFITLIPDDVQGYADDMRQHYKHQPIVAIDWPPRVGKDFFGRLALVEKQDHSTQAESAWYLLRGQVDKIVKLPKDKEISVEDVLQPTDNSLSLRVVIDGPPGIGKTTLCRKLLNSWANGALGPQQYDLVLYCPLRNSQIATATTLAELFEYKSPKVSKAVDWLSDREGKGLLIIFDGWDELSEQLRKSSIATSIIHRKQLRHCSVIVTSRSYASISLLEVDNLSRHVQVIGFFEHEISTVIIQTLQKDQKLAQKLIDENKTSSKTKELNSHVEYKPHFATVQSNKDSQLAVKLINDLKVRSDVLSLCYVPLVCSMVILVYCKEGGHLPTTLTQLYENFILQTIRRHIKRHDINPRSLNTLSSLPSQLSRPLQEMCQIAYTNLANNTKMVFSLHNEVVKEDYLGLMTTFIEYDEEKYQFLHLSIQEFLAAWWIAKHEKKTQEVFKNHFDDDHFRMCLRFVAGLTHLEHESYQQYFNKQLDLQCKREPLYGLESCYLSYFCKNSEITKYTHIKSLDDVDNVPILLLQLLYETQHTALCQLLAQSIKNHSLCLDEGQMSLSLYDWLCLAYFINNSNTTWNHLHLGNVSKHAVSVFTAGLTNNSLHVVQTQCKILEVKLDDPTNELMHKLLQLSLLDNIQECYCELVSGQYVSCLVLLQFLNLHQLRILHLTMTDTPTVGNVYTNKCVELEKRIEMNSTLEEMKIEHSADEVISNTIISVIRGVTKNKKITSFSVSIFYIRVDDYDPPFDPSYCLPDGVLEQLLKDNSSLQALSLDIPDEALPSSLNIVEVNTPLTALQIGKIFCNPSKMTLLIPLMKRCNCLMLHEPCPPHFSFSHLNLHTLTLQLKTAESAIELFTFLQMNTTLQVLIVEIRREGVTVYTSCMGTSLQGMLTQNQTLKCFEIYDYFVECIPNSFLSFLITGLRHNTSLQRLNVNIPFNKDITTFTDIISQKNNLAELIMNFTFAKEAFDVYLHSDSREEVAKEILKLRREQFLTFWMYELLLPAVTNMLSLHMTIRRLRINCLGIDNESKPLPNWKETLQHLYKTIFIHPSLEYIEINFGIIPPPSLFVGTLKDQKKTLIDKHRKEQPYKPLPIVNIKHL
uniref:NACHT domain-containing protein n=1 Tax=Amphimedon queenslandica TaxID=400682 RepID=A0A1X7VNQ8_AMPQE